MKHRLTYANVTATAALALALTGGMAVASGGLAPHSVGTKQLKKNAVVSKTVKDGSLQGRDFAAGQIPAGAQGIQGIQGVPGTNATTFVGEFSFSGAIPASTCVSMSAMSSVFEVGDSALVAPDYAGVTPVNSAITMNAGKVDIAGSLPISICNNSTATISTASFMNVYRIAGPATEPGSARPLLTRH